MVCSYTRSITQMKPFVFAKLIKRREDGATAVEFALLAPVLITLIMLILQIGLALHKGNSVQWAINKAARAALLDDSMDKVQIQAFIDERIRTIDPYASITIDYAVTEVGSAEVGTISGTYYHTIEVPFLPVFTAKFDIDVSVPRV